MSHVATKVVRFAEGYLHQVYLLPINSLALSGFFGINALHDLPMKIGRLNNVVIEDDLNNDPSKEGFYY